MNYFLISNMYPDTKSPGYGSFVKNVVKGLSQEGIYCKYSALIVGKPTSFLNKCFKYFSLYFNIVRHYFKSYDFIYIHYPNLVLPVLMPFYLIKKKRVVVNLHGEDLLYSPKGVSFILGKLNDYFLKKVDAIVVPSKYYRDIVWDRIKDAQKEIIVSPSGGINAEFFYPKQFVDKVNDKKYHIGYIGRIDPRKGWKESIEAISKLPNPSNYQATFIGYGSEIDSLQHYISQISDITIDYIPKVAHDELRKYYAQFDILLFPSMREEESLGLVGIESMACGTPVIGSNIGGIPSYLSHRVNGFLVQPGDTEQIAKYIVEYCQLSKEDKELYYLNCIERSKNYFSDDVIKNLADSFVNLFSQTNQ